MELCCGTIWERPFDKHSDLAEKLPQGGFAGIKVNASNAVCNTPPIYMSVTKGGDDIVCIQSILLTSPTEKEAALQMMY